MKIELVPAQQNLNQLNNSKKIGFGTTITGLENLHHNRYMTNKAEAQIKKWAKEVAPHDGNTFTIKVLPLEHYDNKIYPDLLPEEQPKTSIMLNAWLHRLIPVNKSLSGNSKERPEYIMSASLIDTNYDKKNPVQSFKNLIQEAVDLQI
ncbi:MAG TPA: hypothetical protein DDW90_11115 [Cyanobacteria bacterium UBA9971]|nr:hypothetical protein [Cyanobacteria bacterium UBA9971]